MDYYIYIDNKQKKELPDLYTDVIFLDVTSKSVDEWVKFSPFFPRGNIPIRLVHSFLLITEKSQ